MALKEYEITQPGLIHPAKIPAQPAAWRVAHRYYQLPDSRCLERISYKVEARIACQEKHSLRLGERRPVTLASAQLMGFPLHNLKSLLLLPRRRFDIILPANL